MHSLFRAGLSSTCIGNCTPRCFAAPALALLSVFQAEMDTTCASADEDEPGAKRRKLYRPSTALHRSGERTMGKKGGDLLPEEEELCLRAYAR